MKRFLARNLDGKGRWVRGLMGLALLIGAAGTPSFGQPVERLRTAYSGECAWDATRATLRFTSSGEIRFPNAAPREFLWRVPPEVRHIGIGRNVAVNGAFHSTADLTVAGEDRKTSMVHGTDEPQWAQRRGIKPFTICTFQNFDGVLTISNLTSLNPRGFHVRGWDKVVHAVACDFLDRRGGWHNNSDGFEGGDGSTVHDCYFESGDDIIKVYFDLMVTDTTIKMIQNTVPIQLGWGNYSDGAVGTFRNLTIFGNGGRGDEGNAVISGRQGRYEVTVNIDGCHIENPNGTLVSLREDTMTLRGSITNAHIRLKSYAGEHQQGTNLLTVCGTRERKAAFDCDRGNEARLPTGVAPAMPRAEIEAGLRSHDRALYVKEGWIRDPYIMPGPDNWYYLTGTTPHPGDLREHADPFNVGLGTGSIVGTAVQVWRSKDLINWEYMGTPFILERDSWHGSPGDRLWAPEIHWLGARWALVHCPAKKANLALTSGPELKGPWLHPLGAKLGDKHDPSLFSDGDTWWLLWGNTQIAPLTQDFTGFAAKPVRLDPSGRRTNALGEVKSVIGHEGATLREIGTKYVHFGTAWSTDQMRKGSYNLYYCTADKITGPYGPRRFAGRFLGHGTPFQTRDGKWWCTAFYNANVPPLPREGIETRDLSQDAQTINQRGTTIVPLEVKTLPDGDVYVRAKDSAYATPGPDEIQKF